MSWIDAIADRITGKAPKGARRSKTWRRTRKAFIKKNPTCAFCGSKKKLQVHHKIPFWLAPDLEEDWSNLKTLCNSKSWLNCHLLVGHLGNYRDANPSVDADCAAWLAKLND